MCLPIPSPMLIVGTDERDSSLVLGKVAGGLGPVAMAWVTCN
jgi:hypothetical protein